MRARTCCEPRQLGDAAVKLRMAPGTLPGWVVSLKLLSLIQFLPSDFRSGNVTIFQVSGAIAAIREGALARNLCPPTAAAFQMNRR